MPIGAGFKKIDEIKNGIVLHMKGAGRRYNPQAPTRAELDIMKEKAETLGRTGAKLEETLRRLRTLEGRISIMKKQGNSAAEVDDLIKEFNGVRAEAI